MSFPENWLASTMAKRTLRGRIATSEYSVEPLRFGAALRLHISSCREIANRQEQRDVPDIWNSHESLLASFSLKLHASADSSARN
jgi:hypothetical protein